MTGSAAPLWVEALIGVLLVVSGVLALVGAFGVLRLQDFFMRAHASALANTVCAWCVALASILYFSAVQSRFAIHTLTIIVFLAMTVPVTTILLARAALFSGRQSGAQVPPPLGDQRTR